MGDFLPVVLGGEGLPQSRLCSAVWGSSRAAMANK